MTWHEHSELGLHCLLRLVWFNIKKFYSSTQPLYNTVFRLKSYFCFSYPNYVISSQTMLYQAKPYQTKPYQAKPCYIKRNHVISRIKCKGYRENKRVLYSLLGSNPNLCYIRNCVIRNHVIMSFRQIPLYTVFVQNFQPRSVGEGYTESGQIIYP